MPLPSREPDLKPAIGESGPQPTAACFCYVGRIEPYTPRIFDTAHPRRAGVNRNPRKQYHIQGSLSSGKSAQPESDLTSRYAGQPSTVAAAFTAR
jgi:hypothetical protein